MDGEKSIVSHYHNQKDSDFDPETGIVHGTGSKGHVNHYKLHDRLERNKEIGEASELEKQIENVVSMIDELEIEPLSLNDSEQTTLLEKRKGIAKNKISDVLDNIGRYMIAINHLDNVRIEKDSYDQETYLEKHIEADRNRKRKHNLLIQSLQSTIYFISHNFSQISEPAIEKWEKEQDERGFPILQAKRIEFPDNVLCPDNMNLRDRKQVMKWASQLSYSIEKLKKELSY